MNTTRPEADIEYSRGHGALNGDSAPPLRPPGGRPRRRSSTLRWGLLAGGLSGAALLAVAEFTPLFTIHTRAGQTAIKTVPTGSHDSYALMPVALLAALLSLEVWRNRARLALVDRRPGRGGAADCAASRPARRARDGAGGQRGDRLEERQLEPRRRALSGRRSGRSYSSSPLFAACCCSPRPTCSADRARVAPAGSRPPPGATVVAPEPRRAPTWEDSYPVPVSVLTSLSNATVYQHRERYIKGTRGLSCRSPRSRAVGGPRVLS